MRWKLTSVLCSVQGRHTSIHKAFWDPRSQHSASTAVLSSAVAPATWAYLNLIKLKIQFLRNIQVFNSPLWLVASVLDGTGTEHLHWCRKVPWALTAAPGMVCMIELSHSHF